LRHYVLALGRGDEGGADGEYFDVSAAVREVIAGVHVKLAKAADGSEEHQAAAAELVEKEAESAKLALQLWWWFGGGGWFETLLAAWMRARGTGRRRRSKRVAQEEEGEFAVLEALARRAATAAPKVHAQFVSAALAAEGMIDVDGTLGVDNNVKQLPGQAGGNADEKDEDEKEDEEEEEDAAEGAEEAAETAGEEGGGVARRCWRMLLALDASRGGGDGKVNGGGDGDGGRSELLRQAAAGAAAAVHVVLDLDPGGGRDDARALLAALARAPVPRELPAAAHACALANHASNLAAAEVAAPDKRMETRMDLVDVNCERALKEKPDMSSKSAAELRAREVKLATKDLEEWHKSGRGKTVKKWREWLRSHPAAGRAASHGAAARATDYWRAVLRLVAAGVDPCCGDSDGAGAWPAALMLLRSAEVGLGRYILYPVEARVDS
jgi:hypothetical protein